MNRPRSLDGGIDEIPVPSPTVRGRLWLCGKHVVGPDPEAALTRVGATTIVCLTQPHEIDERYPGYVGWLSNESPSRALWVPTPDLAMRPLAEMRPHLDDLAARLIGGEGLIVHCAAGIGRSGTTAVALLMLLGVGRETALTTVAANRPMAGPEAGAQREFVAELAAALGV